MPSQSASRRERNDRLAAIQKQQASAERRRLILWWVIGVLAVAAIVIPVTITLVNQNDASDDPKRLGDLPTLAINADATKLNTGEPLTTTEAPWALPAQEEPYVQAAGLQLLAQEQLAVHYHAHLDVIVDGDNVDVPSDIGITQTGISFLHTHDASGLIHIEAPTDDKFTLGQVMVEWGVRLTDKCVGGYCTDQDKAFKVFVNGDEYTHDPQDLLFNSHDEIVLWYGDKGTTPDVPDSFDFPPNT